MGIQHIVISNDGITFLSCGDGFGRTRLFYILGEQVRGYFRGGWKDLCGAPADTVREMFRSGRDNCPTYHVNQLGGLLG
jgi:hypothetical protein